MWGDLDKEKAHMVVGFFETENIACASPRGACVREGGLSRAVGGLESCGYIISEQVCVGWFGDSHV